MFYDLEDKKVKSLGENWSASNASIIGDVTLEKNTSIWFNVTLRGDVENVYIGEGSNIQDGSVLHTDPGYPLKIGKDVTIGHLVMLHGCTIEDNSLIFFLEFIKITIFLQMIFNFKSSFSYLKITYYASQISNKSTIKHKCFIINSLILE